MKIEKFVFALTLTGVFVLGLHKALAANNGSPAIKVSALKKKKAGLQTKTRKQVTQGPATRKLIASSTSSSASASSSTLSASSTPSPVSSTAATSLSSSTSAPAHASLTSASATALTSTSVKAQEVAAKPSTEFSGNVDFTSGKDSNIDPDKVNIKANYYQIAPKLNFSSKRWSGSFGASVKDFPDQHQSDMFKQNEASAEISYNTSISSRTDSTTTLSGLFHDERYPDFINGIPGNIEQYSQDDHGMPIRYTDVSIKQKLAFNMSSSLKSEISGSAKHRNALSISSDYAPDIFGSRKFEKDLNELAANGKLTWSAASALDISLSPSIKQIKFTDRQGRQPDGSAGGLQQSAPLYELVVSEVTLDTAIKIGKSSITPTFLVGQTADRALGAEDNSYTGIGLNSTLVLHEASEFTLEPKVMYKKTSFDNWTNGVKFDPLRVDNELTAGVSAGFMLTKNFGLKAGYDYTRAASTITGDTSGNYTEEIVSSTMTFKF